jgi:hypothetical protein
MLKAAQLEKEEAQHNSRKSHSCLRHAYWRNSIMVECYKQKDPAEADFKESQKQGYCCPLHLKEFAKDRGTFKKREMKH